MQKENSIGIVEKKILEFESLTLENGLVIRPLEIAYETYVHFLRTKTMLFLFAMLSQETLTPPVTMKETKSRVTGKPISVPGNPLILIAFLLSVPM